MVAYGGLRLRWLVYGIGALAVATAVVVRMALAPWMGNQGRLILLLLPVSLVAWIGGRRPSLFTLLLAAVVGWYVFLDPAYSFKVPSVGAALQLILFLLVGGVICFLSHHLHTSRRRAVAQRRLYESAQRRYGLLLENATDYAIIFTDVDGTVTDWSVGATRMTGWSRDEMLGQPASRIFTAEDLEKGEDRKELQAAVDGGAAADERWHRRKDGSRFWGSGVMTALRDESGEVVGYGKIFRDLTQRRQTEQTLRQSEERFRVAQELSPNGFTILTPVRDERGTIVDFTFAYLNHAGHRIGGHAPGAVDGRRLSDVSPASMRHPQLFANYVRAAETGESLDYDVHFTDEGKDQWFRLQVVRAGDDVAVSFLDITERIRTLHEVARSRQRFELALKAAPVVLFTQDLDLKYTWIYNPALGHAADAVIGKGENQIIPDADAVQTLTRIKRQVMETGVGAREPVVFRDTDGVQLHYDLVVEPLRDEDDAGRVVGVTCAAMDVSGTKRAEAALRASEARFRFLSELGELTRDEVDPEQVMATVAAKLGQHLGANRCAYADVEADGDTFTVRHDYTDGVPSTVGTYRLDLFGPRAAADQRDGRTLVVEDVDRELPPDQGGTMFNAIAIKAIVCCPLVRQGRLVAMMAVHQATPRRWTADDVSLVEVVVERSWAYIERARAARAVAESEARFRLMANSIPQLAWMARPDGAIFWYNQRWYDYTGTTFERMQGWGWQEVHDPAELPRVVDKFRRHVATGQEWEDTFPLRRHDGQFRWHLSRAVPLRDADGQIILWFGTNTDITEQRQIAEERERLLEAERHARQLAETASRMKDEFLATVSHELRTPLTAIVGWASILQQSKDDPGTIAEGVDTIERNARAQAQLIEDILDVSRITTGKLRLNVTTMDLAGVVDAAVETVRAAADAKGVAVAVDHAARPLVHGDPDRLQQVFWNLLANAIKFTPRGGRVTARTEASESSAVVRVTDTGRGIEPEFLPHVFERFRQADAKTTRQFGGLGLGLSIVRHLTELHGGTVAAESDGLDRGSTFIVRLPIPAVNQNPAADGGPGGDADGTATAATAARQLRRDVEFADELAGKRVLVVDDEADARRMIQAVLTRCGAEVTVVATAADALGLLNADHAFDAMISDIGMPDEDGYALIRRLRAQERGDHRPRLPAAALTAYTRTQDRDRTIDAGFDLYLPKPVQPRDLIQTTATLIRQQR